MINRDWSDEFAKLGAGSVNGPFSSKLQQYLPAGPIEPKLPSLQDFATLVGRSPHTDVTARLYNMILRQHLLMAKAPRDLKPHRGTHCNVPNCDSALRGSESGLNHHESPDVSLHGYLRRSETGPAFLSDFRTALNVFLPPVGVGAAHPLP